MAGDLSSGPRSGLHTQLCGDAHLVELRLVRRARPAAGVRHQRLRRDPARSVRVGRQAARRQLRRRGPRPGLQPEARAGINAEVVKSYREAMQGFAAMRNLDVWYAAPRHRCPDQGDPHAGLDPEAVAGGWRRTSRRRARRTASGVLEAGHAGRRGAADRRRPAAHRPDRGARPGGQPDDHEGGCHAPHRSYRRSLPSDRRKLLDRFRYVDMARKVVGVGSVGTRAWIVLMLGRDEERPVAAPGEGGPGRRCSSRTRQERVQQPRPARGRGPAPDAGRRATSCWAGSAAGHRRRRARLLLPPAVGRQGLRAGRGSWTRRRCRRTRGCAAGRWRRRTPAPATRSRSGPTWGTTDTFDKSMAVFAEKYADQNERDYAALKAAVESGRVEAQAGL